MAKKRPTSKPAKRGQPPPTPARATGPRPRARRRIELDRWALALVLVALLARLWGVADRLPDPSLGINVLDDSAIEETDRTTMGRAWNMWTGGAKALDLNPHTGGWPGFPFYVGLGLQFAYRVVWGLGNPEAEASAFVAHIGQASQHLFLFGRVVCALIGVLTVYLVYLLGRRIAGREVGFLAGLFTALNPLHIMTSQHIADPNLLSLLFVLLAAIGIAKIAEDPERESILDSALTGAMIGFAAASKYVPVILVIPLAVAHGRYFYGRRGLYLALAAAVVAMFLASPFTFLDWKTTVHDIATQRRSLFSDWVGQTAFPFSLPTYLAVSLPHTMGWPAYLGSLYGLMLLWRRSPASKAVLLIPIVMVLANGALKAAQERYMLAAIPILHIAVASALVSEVQRFKERLPRPATAMALGAAVSAAALAWPLPQYFSDRRILALPDTRHLARKWINANIDLKTPVAVELYGPVFAPNERASVVWPFFATQVPLVRPAYHYQWLDGIEYYVLSREVSRRFDADTTNYPVESAYYRWIRANTTVVWKTDPANTSGPQIEVRRVPPSVSTRSARDSLFQVVMPEPSTISRVALWCLDTASIFGRAGIHERAEEWARRGILVGAPRLRSQLCAVLANAQIQLKKYADAEIAVRTCLQTNPRDGELYLYYGIALYEQGKTREALEAFKSSSRFAPNPSTRINIASALTELGYYEDALHELEQVPPNHAMRGTARRDMAVLLINNLGRPVEGIAALREAASLARDPGEARLYLSEADRIQTEMSRKKK
jgi:tetratricopeptide (TPR) repeat protein